MEDRRTVSLKFGCSRLDKIAQISEKMLNPKVIDIKKTFWIVNYFIFKEKNLKEKRRNANFEKHLFEQLLVFVSENSDIYIDI